MLIAAGMRIDAHRNASARTKPGIAHGTQVSASIALPPHQDERTRMYATMPATITAMPPDANATTMVVPYARHKSPLCKTADQFCVVTYGALKTPNTDVNELATKKRSGTPSVRPA